MEGTDKKIDRRSKVYVQDEVYAWLPGELVRPVAKGDATARVRITLPDDWDMYTCRSNHPSLKKGVERTVKLSDYDGNELPLQNMDEDGALLGKSDMADLPHLHEAAILYSLKDRHKNGVPYSRVGDIVVAVNPYQWIDGLYSVEKKYFYAEKLVWNAQAEDFSNRQSITEGFFDRLIHDPHVYETSSHAYRGLAVDMRDQAILVSGESGAGKTETVKILMTHLAALEHTRDSESFSEFERMGRTDIVKKISESSPLFEAFGNATTVANDNSSRFGKFTKLHFRVGKSQATKPPGDVPECALAGSTFVTYLLEKSRVVTHDAGERTYHLFYQLLSAPEEEKVEFWEELGGSTCASFSYVGDSVSDTIEGRTDEEAWHETREALSVFGFNGEKLRTLMRAVCIVLQLGNLTFDLDPSDEEGALIKSDGELYKLAKLMGITPETIRDALTTRHMNTYGEEIVVKLSPVASKDGCDALAKEIYAQLFQALVLTINESTSPQSRQSERAGCISILDLFGFECFAVNRFEQLCINYANERIQQKYVLDTFLSVTKQYADEGIQIYDFSKVDNSDVLALIECRTGLIMVLDEECVRPKGNSESFVYKVKSIHRDSKRLVSDKLHRPWEFAIRHYAGTVKYDCTQFIERNTDRLPTALLDCGCSSKNEMIRSGFQQLASERVNRQSNYRRKRGVASICSKFKSQLTALMSDIKDARTRYIRCIKPNKERQPLVMDHAMTMRQLASAGLVTAIQVSRETFPNHLPYDIVWDRFRCLLPDVGELGNKSVEDKAKYLLNQFLLNKFIEGKAEVVGGQVKAPFACGRTKVFFRSGGLELLESDRMSLYSAKATILQRWTRALLERQRYKAIEPFVVILQATWRCKVVRKEYLKKRNAAVRIQSWARSVITSLFVQRLRQHKAATVIQSSWRGLEPRKTLAKSKKAAAIVQRAIRQKQNRTNFKSSMATVVEEAQMDRKLKHLLEELHEPSPSNKDELLKGSAKMIEYLSRQLYMQRGAVSDLKSELWRRQENDVRAREQLRAANAALAANKLEVARLRHTSTKLEHKVNEFRERRASMKTELRGIQDELKNELTKQKEGYLLQSVSQSKENEHLKEELRVAKAEHAAEIFKLNQEKTLSEEKHCMELAMLQEEIQKLEEAHRDDLTKMLAALETAEEDAGRAQLEEEIKELRMRLKALALSQEAETENFKELLCDQCRLLCGSSARTRSSIARQDVMGHLERSHGSRKLFE